MKRIDWSIVAVSVAGAVATVLILAAALLYAVSHFGGGSGGQDWRISQTIAPPIFNVGHGVCWYEHSDGSMEVGPDRSGVFFAGPRQNWWADGATKEVSQ
jgi:hypothetical protein